VVIPTDPAALEPLVLRLEELIRALRSPDTPRRASPVLRFGAVEVDPFALTVLRDGRRLPITRTEFRLLYVLLHRPGQVVRREELLAEVWGPGVRFRSRAIDTHIARLRQKLEADAANPRHILTVPNLGYRFDPRDGSLPPASTEPTEVLCDLDGVGL